MAKQKYFVNPGDRFGRWLVKGPQENRRHRPHHYCVCDCGKEKFVAKSSLVSGNSVSCGCHRRECVSKKFTKHGLSHLSIYHSYKDMIKMTEEKPMITKDTYVDIRGWTDEEVEQGIQAYAKATGAIIDREGDALANYVQEYGYYYLTVVAEEDKGDIIYIGTSHSIEDKRKLTKEQVLQWPNVGEGGTIRCPLKDIVSYPSVNDIQVMFDIDCFRNAVGIIKDNNEAARRNYTDEQLENQLKRYAQEIMQRALVKLDREPSFEGSFHVGTCNFRVALEWFDETCLELSISVHPKVGTLIQVPLVELEDALRMSVED